MFEQSLQDILNHDAPPDTETWQRLREMLRETETRIQSQQTILEQFISIFNDSSIAQSLTEMDGTIFQINEKAAELVGYPREELLGKRVTDVGVYANPAQRDQMLDLLRTSGRVRDFDVDFQRKSGERIHVLMHWDVFILEDRPCIHATFYDMTKFRQTEAQLRMLHSNAVRQAQELSLLDQARVILARSLDLSTLFRVVVDGIADTFGYGLVSIYLVKGNSLILQHHHGYMDVLANITLDRGVMARCVRTKQSILLPDVRTEPDFLEAFNGVTSEIAVPLFVNGDAVGVLNVESHGGIVLTEADLRLMVALSEHISLAIQRAQLYTSLAESERREREQRLFAEALRDTAAGLNASLNLNQIVDLLAANLKRVMPPFQGVRVMFVRGTTGRIVAHRGYPEGAFPGIINVEPLDCGEGALKERKTWLYPDVRNALISLEGVVQDWVCSVIGATIMVNERAVGVLYLDSSIPNGFQEKHVLLLKAFADQAGIALQKARLNKRLRRQMHMRLQQAIEYERRVSEMRAHLGIAISHEFRTPLTTIHTSADLIRLYDGRLSPERRRELLAKINTQVKHLTHLLDDIMMLSRSELIGVELNRSTVDLDQLCRDIAAEIQWIAGSNHRILVFGDANCQQAHIDEDLTRRVLINLLTNAIKYSPEGGKVLLTLKRQGDDAVIEVSDNGIGIPQADFDHLFQSFHRAGNVGSIPGTGLGLTLVKQAVEMQQGSIHVESVVGVGTTFTVRLPITLTSD